jgi:flagellar biosynthesis protein FlhG
MDISEPVVQDPSARRTPKVVAIGGGKGGVGKTVLAASIGMGLAMLKRQVVCIDADFAGANLRNALGIRNPEKTYGDFLLRGEPLESVLTPYPGMESLRILCGADGAVESSQMPHAKKEKLIRHLRRLDADFIVIDLGAGSHYAILDLFLEADLGIVLINPDPLSILESYNFVKQAFFRKLLREFHDDPDGVLPIIKRHANAETYKNPSGLEQLLGELNPSHPEARLRIETVLGRFHPALLINKAGREEDEANGLAVRAAARDLLGVDMPYLGKIRRDDAVVTSLEAMEPFISHDPKCGASRDLADIVIQKLMHYGLLKALFEKSKLSASRPGRDAFAAATPICSIQCFYWEECAYKTGGYPCKLQHLTHIKGFIAE